MSISRRQFFKSAGVSLVAAGILARAGGLAFGQKKSTLLDSRGNFQIPSETLSSPLLHFTQATFEAYLQSTFLVTVGPVRAVDLTLVKVEDTRTKPHKGMPRTEGECFSLVFRAPEKLSDLQQTYVLQHEALGKFSLFLVDAGEKSDGVYYVAVINHTQPADAPKKM